ncbi:cellulose synthase-like protein E6 isoform X1 [Ziziphus jujuba]|uniref:Cellulose synthase-like protein E6 isoform X1 n=1 Tax=Ziziphus jujuba TaxID=326968 RepID=A0ABM4AAL9_ZIZJJ|nr:cellulose synthase-like protein E6 isoform X1 [Ziziphus jujuba]
MDKQEGGVAGEDEAVLLPLFERKAARFRGAYRVFSSTIMVGICLIWFYRLLNIPNGGGETGKFWAWIGMFMAELGFGIYWISTQSFRWNVSYTHPFKDRLSHSKYRYEDKLPGVDIFVCTADPIMEPPTLAINTVLSAMSYNYPPEKLSIYLSDDAGSEFTFYALLEASHFSKYWIPFCKRFKVEPRSPGGYFDLDSSMQDNGFGQELLAIKKLYEEMKNRIESAIETGKIPKETKDQHKGFSEWDLHITKQNHQSIVQSLIDGRDINATDNDGHQLPSLVYMAREKRHHWPHNFKAGAMNSLMRVSTEISNAPFILNLDCDMYANDADTIREILCFFMDEKEGHEVAYVQLPQNYDNLTKNDIYSNAAFAASGVEFAGAGGYGAAFYFGTGCLHRRESLFGKKYSKRYRGQWNIETKKNVDRTISDLEEASKILASCSYEKDTEWGKEMGLIYGCPVEDIVTGLAIQCRGWKSVYYNPDRKAFLGVAPVTLDTALVQHKRWSEGMFQIFLSKYCPFIYGHGVIKLSVQMVYCVYLLWAPISLPVLYYVIVPPVCLLDGVSLFPEVSSIWFVPFAYVFIARNGHSIIESLSCDSTLKGWWNSQRMWLTRRTTSYFFGFLDTILRQLGLSQTKFSITTKVITEDVSRRYEQEVMEFGSSTIMFTIMATLALLNLFTLVGGIRKVVLDFRVLDQLIPQIVLCALVVVVNLPIYQALFLRSDKGRIPFSVLFKSMVLASLVCLIPVN